MSNKVTKAPRIYGDYPLQVGKTTPLIDEHSHYLLSVMRKNDGDDVRIFNGLDGEFLGKIKKLSKKQAALEVCEHLRPFQKTSPRIHLYFAPIKKDRLAILIEKSVELGVTDFHPILTDHTENRKIRSEKIEKYIVEAAEQCERLDIPKLHPIMDVKNIPETHIYCALERHDAPLFTPEPCEDLSIMIGPEGGWSNDECDTLLKLKNITPVSLGDRILRAETAAFFMLSRVTFNR